MAQMYSPQGLLPQIGREFDIDPGSSSWVIGATTIGVAIGTLPWARVSDRLGRVATMRWAAGIAMVLGLTVPFAPTFEAMIVLRGIEGLALGGLPALAVTALAETVHPRTLGAAVGSYVAGTTLGGLTGRLVAGAVADSFGWRLGLAAVAILAAAAAVAFVVAVPKTAIPQPQGTRILGGLIANVRNTGVLVLVLQAFLLMGGFVAVYNTLAFRLEQAPYNLNLMQVSWLFLAYLAGAISSNWVWRFARTRPPTGVLLVCLAVMLGGVGLTMLSPLWPSSLASCCSPLGSLERTQSPVGSWAAVPQAAPGRARHRRSTTLATTEDRVCLAGLAAPRSPRPAGTERSP